MGNGCLQRSSLQPQEQVPALLCTQQLRRSALGERRCSRARGKCWSRGAGGDKGQAWELWYLHGNAGAVGGSQQCHLLMTEGCDSRLSRHDCPRSDYGNLGSVKIKISHVLQCNSLLAGRFCAGRREGPGFLCTGCVPVPPVSATITVCVSPPASSSSGPARARPCVTTLMAVPRACSSSCDRLTCKGPTRMLSAGWLLRTPRAAPQLGHTKVSVRMNYSLLCTENSEDTAQGHGRNG